MGLIDEIKSGETKRLEFKQKITSLDGVIKTSVAFANSGGGKIFLSLKSFQVAIYHII